jgi:hypothetical protein
MTAAVTAVTPREPSMDLTMTPTGLTPELLNALNAGNVH